MPPPEGAGTNALRTTRNLGARRGWREVRQAIKRASLSRPVSLQPNLRLPRSAAIGDIPPPSSTKPRSVPPRQQCGAASKEPAEVGSSPEGSMDTRAPASMRLLLSYSRARRSILLSPSKGGRGDIEARARLLRSAGGAPLARRRGACGERRPGARLGDVLRCGWSVYLVSQACSEVTSAVVARFAVVRAMRLGRYGGCVRPTVVHSNMRLVYADHIATPDTPRHIGVHRRDRSGSRRPVATGAPGRPGNRSGDSVAPRRTLAPALPPARSGAHGTHQGR